jgi:hypothetical protein
MTNRELVRSIYRGARCEEFYLGGRFPDQRYIIRYRSNCSLRRDPIGWGATIKESWADAANTIKVDMLATLEK